MLDVSDCVMMESWRHGNVGSPLNLDSRLAHSHESKSLLSCISVSQCMSIFSVQIYNVNAP